MAFFVYILASKRNGTLYVGMTDDLVKRIWQHRNNIVRGFTYRYSVKTLVWYESHETRESAFLRERRIKKWNRAWKLKLIEQDNPYWRDLWRDLRRRKDGWIPAFAGMSGERAATQFPLVPAKAGTQREAAVRAALGLVPAFAGMSS